MLSHVSRDLLSGRESQFESRDTWFFRAQMQTGNGHRCQRLGPVDLRSCPTTKNASKPGQWDSGGRFQVRGSGIFGPGQRRVGLPNDGRRVGITGGTWRLPGDHQIQIDGKGRSVKIFGPAPVKSWVSKTWSCRSVNHQKRQSFCH